MRHPRKRRPRHVYRWEGVVKEVDGDQFAALLTPVDHDGPQLIADFDLTQLPWARPGVVFRFYTRRRGRNVRSFLRERVLPPWTEEELEQAREWGRQMAAEIQELVS